MGRRICRELKKSKLGDERDFYSLLLMRVGGVVMSRKSWHPSTLNLILRVRHQLGLVLPFDILFSVSIPGFVHVQLCFYWGWLQ